MRVNHDYDRGGAVAYLAAYELTRLKQQSIRTQPDPAPSSLNATPSELTTT
jgi:hypothetical protein